MIYQLSFQSAMKVLEHFKSTNALPHGEIVELLEGPKYV